MYRMSILGPLNPVQLLAAGRRLVLAGTRRIRPDHQAIARREVRFSPANMASLYLYVVVAPSRSAPRKFDGGQVRRARDFTEDAFTGVFPEVPEWADERLTLFTLEGPDRKRERALYVHRTGLVELLWALTPEERPGEEPDLLLDATEMAWVVAQLAAAVGRRAYAEISNAGRGRRRLARVDWWFHLATSISGANGSRTWTGLTFAGEAPRRARNWSPAMPTDGYAWKELMNSNRSLPPGEVARAFLTALLGANGYYEFADAVALTARQSLLGTGATPQLLGLHADQPSVPDAALDSGDMAGTQPYADLADRIEDVVRAYVLQKMPPVPSGELESKPFRELLHIYGNWRGRHPYARPRTVHRSQEMLSSAEAQTFRPEIDELVRKMEAGEDLKPHLSRAVDIAFLSTQERVALPRSQRERDLDRMLADWGIHHLHLSNVVEADGFVERGEELLFALFGRDDAYLVGIYMHGDWLDEDLVPIVVRNWPGVGPFRRLNYALGPSRTQTEQERQRNRRQGVSGGFVEVDGEWYGTLGQTAAGMPLPHTQPVMALGEELRQLRDDPQAKLSRLAELLDAAAGHPVTGEWAPYVKDDTVGLQRGDDARVQLGVLPGET